MKLLRAFLALTALIGLAACSGQKSLSGAVFHADSNPPSLSDWGVLNVTRGHLVPSADSTVYHVRAPLFTDYAHKLRTIHTPQPAAIRDDGSLDFAVGTIITKTFYYPEAGDQVLQTTDAGEGAIDLAAHRVIETRLLVKREAGWEPVSYVWNADETEAALKRTGAVRPLQLASNAGGAAIDFAYVVPNENQCSGCHATNSKSDDLFPLGATAPQFADRSAMIVAGVMKPGVFTAQLDYRNAAEPLDSRARSYLAANCAHCHNPVGPADTSGLDLSLTAETPLDLGRCKPPIAAGSGTGGHKFSIVPGQSGTSIMPYRMASTNPGAMMPELGRSLVHAEGVALIRDWINQMEGECD